MKSLNITRFLDSAPPEVYKEGDGTSSKSKYHLFISKILRFLFVCPADTSLPQSSQNFALQNLKILRELRLLLLLYVISINRR